MKYIGIDYSLIEGRPEFWIYFSTNPVPVEYTHKIAAYRINKGFLRILYTPKNYELLIRNTPPEISRQLRRGCAGTLRVRNGRSIYKRFQRKEVHDMNEKITAQPPKEERQEVLKEIRQLENRKKILENKQRNEERRVRTRRLIERGAILEGIFPLASSLSGAEVKAFLIALSYLPGAAELTANLPKSGDMP